MEPVIVYQDADLIAVNKPAGMHSVDVSGGSEKTLAAWLRSKFPKIETASEKPGDGGLIQRLDSSTSGLILAAKNRPTWEKLRAQLLAGEIEKSYLALVEGLFPKKPTTTESFLGNPNRNAKKIRVYHENPGPKARALPARTEFILVLDHQGPKVSLVRASAHVARRHQIRAHAADLGYPLVGDTLYGSSRPLSSLLPGADGILPEFILHAELVIVTHPKTGEIIELQAPMPNYGGAMLLTC